MRSCFGTELFPASFHIFFFCQFLFPVAISSISLKTKVLDLAQQMCADAGAFFAFAVLLWVFRSAHGWARAGSVPLPFCIFGGRGMIID